MRGTFIVDWRGIQSEFVVDPARATKNRDGVVLHACPSPNTHGEVTPRSLCWRRPREGVEGGAHLAVLHVAALR